MTKKVKLFGGIAIAFCVGILISLIILLKTTENYDIIGKYHSPVCEYDLHGFENEVCIQCGLEFKECAVFISNIDNSDMIKFSKCFDTLEEYYKLNERIGVLSSLFIITILVLLFSIVITFRLWQNYKAIEDKNKKKIS